jgi:hypothetical protein
MLCQEKSGNPGFAEKGRRRHRAIVLNGLAFA